MQPTKFATMRANRARVITWPAAAVVPDVPVMVINGRRYVEAMEMDCCAGCAFDFDSRGCRDSQVPAEAAFGGNCGKRSVIYIKAE